MNAVGAPRPKSRRGKDGSETRISVFEPVSLNSAISLDGELTSLMALFREGKIVPALVKPFGKMGLMTAQKYNLPELPFMIIPGTTKGWFVMPETHALFLSRCL